MSTRVSGDLFLILSAGLLMACAARQQPPSPPPCGGDCPTKEQVLALMYELAPRVEPCLDDDVDHIQLRIELSGPRGQVVAFGVLESSSGGVRPSDVSAQTLECIRGALVGQPAPQFRRDVFRFAYPIAGRARIRRHNQR